MRTTWSIAPGVAVVALSAIAAAGAFALAGNAEAGGGLDEGPRSSAAFVAQ